MAKIITVSLGGMDYEIVQLPIGASRAWREKFAAPIEGIISALQFAGGLMSEPLSDGAALGSVVGRLGGVLMSYVAPTVLGSIDTLFEMLLSYAPGIAADRIRIESAAYDDEIVRAFVEVLKLAYPFSEILQAVRPGPTTQGTKKN